MRWRAMVSPGQPTKEGKHHTGLDPRSLIPNVKSQCVTALGFAIPRAPARKLVYGIKDLAPRLKLVAPDGSTTAMGVVLHPAMMAQPRFTCSAPPEGTPNALDVRKPKSSQGSNIKRSRVHKARGPRVPLPEGWLHDDEVRGRLRGRGDRGGWGGRGNQKPEELLTDEVIENSIEVDAEASVLGYGGSSAGSEKLANGDNLWGGELALACCGVQAVALVCLTST